MPAVATVSHFDNTTPAEQTGMQNVEWQQGTPYAGTVVYQGQTINVLLTDISAQVRNLGGVDARSTTSETIGLASQGMLVTFTNASPVAVTLEYTVPMNFMCWVACEGSGGVTLTPASGLIDGAASLTLGTLEGVTLFYDGTLWWTDRGLTSGGGGGFTAGGDLSGSSTVQEVIGILSKAIDGTSPSDGQVLQYSAGTGKWELVTLSGPGGASAPWNNMLAPSTVTPPVLSALTWGNQGTASAAANAGGALYFSQLGSGTGSDNVRHLYKAAPGTPWTLTIGVVPGINYNNWNIAGLVLRDSSAGPNTGRIIALWVGSDSGGAPCIWLAQYNSYTSFSGTPTGPNDARLWIMPITWMSVTDDGTNLIWKVSIDGQNFKTIDTVLRTAWLDNGPNQAGIGINPINGATDAVFVHWAGI